MSVLAMSISVFADDPEPTPTIPPDPLEPVIEGVVNYYVWLILNSWGIDITQEGVEGFTETINVFIEEQLQEFVDSIPSIYSISTFIAPWQAGFDYWGNLRFNSKMTEDVTMFVEWLNDKFGLQDNDSEEVIVPVQVLGEYIVHNLPVRVWNTNNNGGIELLEIIPYECSVFFVTYEGTAGFPPRPYTGYACYVLSENPNAHYEYRNYDSSGQYTSSDHTLLYYNNTNTLRYRKEASGNDLTGYAVYEASNTVGSDVPNQTTFFDNFNSITSVGESVSILTSTINLPPDDPNYTSGDYITIVDNQPIYSSDWPDTVSVDNLPAVISTSSVDNPHLEEAYRPIQGLIEYAKDGISVCTSLLYELPDEMVYMWYGVIASLIIWGMIKLMREH